MIPGFSARSPYPFLIAGKWVDSSIRRSFSPFSKKLPVPGGGASWEVAEAREEHLGTVFGSLESGLRTMGGLTRARRSRILEDTARLLEHHREELAALMVQEIGKPLSAARFEVERAASTFRTASHLASGYGTTWMPGDAVPQGIGMTGLVERVPRGPVLAITPYNFPLNLLAHKLAPAIASGCPVIAKPAPFGGLTALSLGAILLEAGLPGEALSIVPCDIPGTIAMVEHPEIPVVSFTGSDLVGWSIRNRVPRKQVLLELGGNAAVLVADDADLSGLPERLVNGAFAYAGQVCISIQRVMVAASRFEEVLDGMVRRVNAIVADGGVGDPGDPGTVMGPLIHETHAERVWKAVHEAVDGGARSETPLRKEGNLVYPIILTGTSPDDAVEREEVFGPVVTISTFDSADAAIARINCSRFGLQAGIYTSSLERGLHWARRIETGGVLINEIPTFRLDHWPYGGIKDSGSGSEGVLYAMDEMTRPKLTAFRLRPEGA